MLYGLCVLAGLLTVVILADVAYQVISGARLAMSTFGVSFLWHSAWAPNFGRLGAATLLFGTAASAAMAMVIATPLSIAGLYTSRCLPPTGCEP